MKKIYLLVLFAAIAFQSKAQSCSDLFISEYIEGITNIYSSFNKAIEIYNPTSGSVSLDNYVLQTYSNGSDTLTFDFNLHGTLASNDVYVISNSQADSVNILPVADTTSLVCNWNGNDAVVLINKVTGDTLDIIGIVGDNPGNNSGWDVDTGSTKDHSLVRMPSVQEGTTDWSLSVTQWIVYAANDFSHLGSHAMTPCSIIIPSVFFLSDSFVVDESAGSISFSVGITNPNATATSVDVSVVGGTATNGADYDFSSPQTITFPAGSSTPIDLIVTITDDLSSENDETIGLSLSNPTNQATVTNGISEITIIDNDGLSVGNYLSSASIKIFPTVSSGIFTVNCELNSMVSVTNIFGNEIYNKKDVEGNLKLDLQTLERGVYFITVENAEARVVRKVIVQ